MTVIDTSAAGQKFGFLTVAYSKGSHDIACRCVCTKLVHVAAADLISGVVTSCGCQPASPQYHEQQAGLRAQLRREITFASALLRR